MACIASFEIMNPKLDIPEFISKRDTSDLNLHRFAVDLTRQNLPSKLGPSLDKNPNATYEMFHEAIVKTRDKFMPLTRKRFNRKKHISRRLRPHNPGL